MPTARRTREVLEAIAANIRRWRAVRDWNQEQLAHEAKMSPAHLRSIESGRRNLTIATFIAIVDALEVAPGDLFQPAKLPRLERGRPPKRKKPESA